MLSQQSATPSVEKPVALKNKFLVLLDLLSDQLLGKTGVAGCVDRSCRGDVIVDQDPVFYIFDQLVRHRIVL